MTIEFWIGVAVGLFGFMVAGFFIHSDAPPSDLMRQLNNDEKPGIVPDKPEKEK